MVRSNPNASERRVEVKMTRKQYCPDCHTKLDKEMWMNGWTYIPGSDCKEKHGKRHTNFCNGCKSFWRMEKGKFVSPRCGCLYN